MHRPSCGSQPQMYQLDTRVLVGVFLELSVPERILFLFLFLKTTGLPARYPRAI
jgi:hypothetical protein